MAKERPCPWAGLEEFRGKNFKGEWPTFPEMLEIQKLRYPDCPCLSDFDGPNGTKRTLTYKETYQKAITLAYWLIKNGLKKGDRVAVAGKNSPEWAIAYMATLLASGIVIPIADALHDPEAGNIIKASTQ